MLVACVACGILTAPALTLEECLDRHEIGWAASALRSPAPDAGSGVLEQRFLENDLVVWAELVNVEFKAVESEAVKFELKGRASTYESSKHTLLGEVDLRVREYLKGEGPDLISAIVEGQVVFNSPDIEDCAKLALEAEVGQLFGSKEGIALLDSTSDPNLYHMGRARENFGGWLGHYSTWLPYKDGSFDSGGSDGWISFADVRRRGSGVIEEYTHSQDEGWQSCVYQKYFDKGRDPWAYQGGFRPYEDYRDHDIIFNGERAPVPSGAMVWNYPDPRGYRTKIHMSLEGEDADLFEVAYQPEYELANRWRTAPGVGGGGLHLAIWYIPPEGRLEQWEGVVPGHVVTAVEDLAEGEYEFNLRSEYRVEDSGVCEQHGGEPQKFRVIVDRDRPTVPPAPTNVQVAQDREGWTISWDPVGGADTYWFKEYRLDGGGEEIDVAMNTNTEDTQYHIRLSDMKGCGDVIYIEIWTHGDGMTYLWDFGENSEPIQLRTEPCAQ